MRARGILISLSNQKKSGGLLLVVDEENHLYFMVIKSIIVKVYTSMWDWKIATFIGDLTSIGLTEQ